jgi:hypothetical protein
VRHAGDPFKKVTRTRGKEEEEKNEQTRCSERKRLTLIKRVQKIGSLISSCRSVVWGMNPLTTLIKETGPLVEVQRRYGETPVVVATKH